MKKYIIKIAAFLFLILTASAGRAQADASPWPTFHGNIKHTGVSQYSTDIKEPYLKWKFNAEQAIETSPVIGAEGTIYFGSLKNNFFALNRDGTEKWRFTKEGEEFRSAPSIGKDGTIYFASLYDLRPVYNISHKRDMEYGKPRLYALNPDGALKWEFEVGGVFSGTINSPLIGPDGTIYIGAGSNDMTEDAEGGYRFMAINPDGTEKWSFKTFKEIYSSAAMADDGTIIFGCADGTLYALNSDGTEKWKFIKDGYFDSTPAIGSDGTIYISSTNRKLYAVSSEGKEKWHFQVDEFFETNPSIGKDGTIYFGIIDKGVKDHHLYALNPDGTLKWKYETQGGVYSTPAIDSNGIIYFGSYDSYVYSLNSKDGSFQWKFKLGGPIVVSPSIDESGTLYFGAWDNYLYAIDGIKRDIIKIEHKDGEENRKRKLKDPCGDNVCDPGEEIDCRDDCGLQFECGDGICDQMEFCKDDCGEQCGDGICEKKEKDCPEDCSNKKSNPLNNFINNPKKNSRDWQILIVFIPLAVLGVIILARKIRR